MLLVCPPQSVTDGGSQPLIGALYCQLSEDQSALEADVGEGGDARIYVFHRLQVRADTHTHTHTHTCHVHTRLCMLCTHVNEAGEAKVYVCVCVCVCVCRLVTC